MFRYILLIVAATCSSAALACSCIEYPTLEELLEQNDEVFLGQASVVEPVSSMTIIGQRSEFRVFIDVVEVFKGQPPTEVIGTAAGIYDGSPYPAARTSCGTGLHPNMLFLVFRKSGETPVFEGCSHKIMYVNSYGIRRIEELVRRGSDDP